jgi:4-nitrophenyl phosphatase
MIASNIKALILDMDGVLWTENNPIGDLPEIFHMISQRSLAVALATNNSTRTPDQFITRLKGFGINDLEPWQVITSSLALADEIARIFPNKGNVFIIGEEGLKVALQENGFSVVNEDNAENVIAVAVGIDRNLSFWKLRRATLLINKGVPFFGTNPDKTFPTPEGLILGTGAILAAITTATGVAPIIMGKPSPTMIALARHRMGVKPEETLVVGDRLETDIAAGQADACLTAILLSGVTGPEAALAWRPPPNYFADDLYSLLR